MNYIIYYYSFFTDFITTLIPQFCLTCISVPHMLSWWPLNGHNKAQTTLLLPCLIKQVSNNIPFHSPHFFFTVFTFNFCYLLLIYLFPYLQFNLNISIYFIFTSLVYPISIYLLTHTLYHPPTTAFTGYWSFTTVITHTYKYILFSCVAILLELLDLEHKGTKMFQNITNTCSIVQCHIPENLIF